MKRKIISWLDLLVLNSGENDAKCTFDGPHTFQGKVGMFAALIEILDSKFITNIVFDSAEKAKSWAEKFVEAVRKMPFEKIVGDNPSEDWKSLEELINEGGGVCRC